MAHRATFIEKMRTKALPALESEIRTRQETIQRLSFDLTFGNVGALKALRAAKRELAQLLTLQSEQSRASQVK